MFAVLSVKGNQYKVNPSEEYKFELIEGKKGEKVNFPEVLLISDEKKTIVGTPLVKGASVDAEIIENDAKDKKVRIFKFRAKKRYQRTAGHRQSYTVVKIIKINLPNEK
jgi:large subunit ribosomal protein L21